MSLSEELLKIGKPEGLFPGNPEEAKKKYYQLAKHWHPDTCHEKNATEVFQHVKILYETALKKFETNTWHGKSRVSFYLKGNALNNHVGELVMDCLISHPFDLGIYYVGEKFVTYIVNEDHKDLWTNAQIRTTYFKYGSPNMEKEISKYLPIKTSFFQLRDGRFGMTVHKDPELLLLRDVLEHYQSVDPKHIAWILSSLYNMACYLNYAQLVHNEISLDTYFISPKNHVGALLGGWFYTTPNVAPIKQVSARTFNHLPWVVKTKKYSSGLTDLELIRCVGRELAGNKLSELPAPMLTRLRDVATEDALKEYSEWRKTLEKSFGKRTFTEMTLDSKTLYDKG